MLHSHHGERAWTKGKVWSTCGPHVTLTSPPPTEASLGGPRTVSKPRDARGNAWDKHGVETKGMG